MPIRLSQLFLRTLREDPADAEVNSHRLLVRAGYIRRAAPGVYTWLPLGLAVKAKIERVVREEMANAGAQEVFFPALLPREPFEATNRWTEYGDNLFRLQDRKKADYLLAPTHEEMFTLLVKDLYSSYKDLPVCLYQIQNKYRDEARPRAGLLRGREFVMKDAYSFDLTDEGLTASYRAQRDAYERIFTRLGVDYVIVKADAGAMGGSASEEFLSPSPIGEDTFVRSPGGYAANVEAVTTVAPEALPINGLPEAKVHPSPNTPTIETLVALANKDVPRTDGRLWNAGDTLKNVVLALTSPEGKRSLVVVGLPGDREVDAKRAEAAFSPNEVEPASEADFAANPELVKGYIGPVKNGQQVLGIKGSSKIRYLLDPRVVDGTAWITGANEDQKHVFDLVKGRDFDADGVVDIAEVRAGDPAPDGSGPLELARGIEIGHVFQLGRKYAEALGLQVLDENGKLVTVTMGSYGIGVTRLVAVLAEANNDEKGLIWPEAVSPADVYVVAAGKDDHVYAAAEQLVAQLESAGKTVIFDDRVKVSPGVKFGDAELIGVPNILIVGKGLEQGEVDLWNRRSGERRSVPLESAVAELVK
ncbi:proline--tRNA ligase [Candidatus Rhodoluna planktonica]|uniref:Proline--tRNA ligase n=1 Tax=Candidatus Rhodoluna planktonica TaxID=535712 RepID=A0A1D9DZL7_9MICO|nr:proline--tRNA ligase [Candidatus Rhodoluna planktonica]AOY56257.1 proline--tRNA ligase [Candidatus Rhodoluna planktonica]